MEVAGDIMRRVKKVPHKGGEALVVGRFKVPVHPGIWQQPVKTSRKPVPSLKGLRADEFTRTIMKKGFPVGSANLPQRRESQSFSNRQALVHQLEKLDDTADIAAKFWVLETQENNLPGSE